MVVDRVVVVAIGMVAVNWGKTILQVVRAPNAFRLAYLLTHFIRLSAQILDMTWLLGSGGLVRFPSLILRRIFVQLASGQIRRAALRRHAIIV